VRLYTPHSRSQEGVEWRLKNKAQEGEQNKNKAQEGEQNKNKAQEGEESQNKAQGGCEGSRGVGG
jgi:hypothetical protein